MVYDSGIIQQDIIQNGGDFYFVSTVNLPMRRLLSVIAEWRDDWWTPPYPNETMVWTCDKMGNRSNDIVHCQGYRKAEVAKIKHSQLCKRISRMGKIALNGREYQVQKLEDGVARGLIKDIARKTKGLCLT